MNFLLVACGGALGSMMRYGVNLFFASLNFNFPMAALVCNVLGSFVLGLVIAFSVRYIPEAYRLFLVVGVCGGFTTFSTFSLDAIRLLQSGNWLMFTAYVLITVLIGILALYLGLKL